MKSLRNIVKLKEFQRLVIPECLLLMICGWFAILDHAVPDRIYIFNTESLHDSPLIAYVEKITPEATRTVFNSDDGAGPVEEKQYTAKLFNLIPVKDVTVIYFSEHRLIPGGTLFGIKFYTEGLIIVGFTDIISDGKRCNPAEEAGLQPSDVILGINGILINNITQLDSLLRSSNGSPLILQILREEERLRFSVEPKYVESDKRYHMGWWLLDSTTGFGTITFIDPVTGTFGGLGHGICDAVTGKLMPFKEGVVIRADVAEIIPGVQNNPGGIKGLPGAEAGSLLKNTESGVFGVISADEYKQAGTALPIGLRQEVEEGDATLLTTVDNEGVKEFKIRITQIYSNAEGQKNFAIEVVDPELLEITGGIIQGMSGSPIIQKGKIIGAATHVLVSDPTKGYGIFLDNMLSLIEGKSLQK